MKVLHYIWSTNFGGIERLVMDLGTAQKKLKGYKVGVLAGQDQGEFSEAFHSTFDAFTSLGFSRGFDLSPRRAKNAFAVMQCWDVVHLHTYNPIIARAAAKSGKPIVYTEHGNFGFGRKRTMGDRAKSGMLPRFLNRSVSHLTFNSTFTQRVAFDRYRIQRVPNTVVYNGINFSDEAQPAGELLPEHAEQLAGKLVIGTTSRLAGFKRVDRLVDAFARFAVNKDNVCLLLVGDGPRKSELVQQAKQLGVNDKVVFAGFQSNISDYQAAMDICVFASENEPFGLVAVETMKLGKPTIVLRDGGGIVEIVQPACPDDVVHGVDGLVERLVAYDTDHGLLTRDSEKRIQRAREFKIGTMADNMDKVYQTLPGVTDDA